MTRPLHHDDRFIAAMAESTPVVTLGFLRRSRLGVAVIGRDGGLLYLGEDARDFLGADADRAEVGQPWWRLWPQDRWPALRNAVTRAGLGDRVTLPGDAGSTLTLTSVRDATKQITRILAVQRADAVMRAPKARFHG